MIASARAGETERAEGEPNEDNNFKTKEDGFVHIHTASSDIVTC